MCVCVCVCVCNCVRALVCVRVCMLCVRAVVSACVHVFVYVRARNYLSVSLSMYFLIAVGHIHDPGFDNRATLHYIITQNPSVSPVNTPGTQHH